MKKSTKFGLIANLGAILIGFAISIALGIVIDIFGGVDLFDDAIFSGIFSVVVSFIAFYIVLWSMLKDKKLKKVERAEALKTTFIIYIGLAVIFSVIFYNQIAVFGLIGWVSTVLEIAAVWAAIKIVDQSL
jgi:hypothetical protein